MMNYLKLVPVVAIIVITALAYTMFRLWQDERAERIRQAENTEQLLTSQKYGYDLSLNLTKQEFYEYNKKMVQEIIDTLNIKKKQITNVITNEYHYQYGKDSTILIPALNDSTFGFSKRFDNCLYISGTVDPSNRKLYFDTTLMDYKSTSVKYWERTKKFLFIKYHKELFEKTYNSCSGNTIVKKVEIVN